MHMPYAHTDFIFAVIGEELGFLGTASVLAAFMAIAMYGRRIAWRARAWRPQDPFAFYVAAGATFIVVFQALVNIAVVTATAPTKGVSLPFISVGGSNLLMAATCVALLYNVARWCLTQAGRHGRLAKAQVPKVQRFWEGLSDKVIRHYKKHPCENIRLYLLRYKHDCPGFPSGDLVVMSLSMMRPMSIWRLWCCSWKSARTDSSKRTQRSCVRPSREHREGGLILSPACR